MAKVWFAKPWDICWWLSLIYVSVISVVFWIISSSLSSPSGTSVFSSTSASDSASLSEDLLISYFSKKSYLMMKKYNHSRESVSTWPFQKLFGKLQGSAWFLRIVQPKWPLNPLVITFLKNSFRKLRTFRYHFYNFRKNDHPLLWWCIF